MKYTLTGKVCVRNLVSLDPMEITKDHTEVVEADTREEAIEVSLEDGTFTEYEEPYWEQGYPLVTEDTLTLKEYFDQDEELQQLKKERAEWEATPDEHYDEYIDNQVRRLNALIFARKSALTAMHSGVDYVDPFNPYEDSVEW